MRTCRKTACRWPAAASLSYRYDTRQVWLLDLPDEPDPSLYDLCPHHADTLVVMRGWDQVDQRTHAEPVVEPAGRDLLPGSGHPPVGAAGYGNNRYKALVADLPRVAAELAEHTSEHAGADAGSVAAEADAADVEAARRVPVRAPVPSRDLAPMPVAEPAPAADVPAPGSTAGPHAVAATEVPGQLAIPVEHDDDEPRIGEAVVVSITAGRRRAPV